MIRYSSLVVFTAIFVTTLLVPISRTGESETDWDLRMTSISVGDGSAHVVETPSSCSLFDAGTISRLSGGSSVIVPALAAIGCLRFDAVFISHPHLDHFSAIPEIAEAFDIDRVFATESFLRFANTSEAPGVLIDALRKKSIHIEQISSGDEMTIDGFVWSTLHPRIGYQSRIVNDGSLVFQIRPEADRIVVSPDSSPAWLTLCGDAQNEAIATVLASSSLTASLAMELPHHGALSDGLRSFVHKLNPRILLQSTGNRRFQFDRIWSVVENMDRGVTCRDGALRTTWFRCPPETGATCRISLERWSGERWVEMVEHTVR